MASQQDPLIENGRPNANEDDFGEDGPENGLSQAAPEAPNGFFIWQLAFSAGISGLLFGYDTGVISATLVSIDTSLSNRPLTSLDKSIITSCTALFALLISPFASVLADTFGRKRVILLADILFVLGALLQAWCSTVSAMVAGRSIVGAAVGAASFVVPLYIAELAPATLRGRLVTTNVLFITLGQVVAYVLGWAFAEHGNRATGWRWMVGLGAFPAVLQIVLLLFMPETPRWLVKAGKPKTAREVLYRVAGNTAVNRRHVDTTLKNIEQEIRLERQERDSRPSSYGSEGWRGDWHDLFHVRRNKRALAIAALLQGLQQLCGFNSLMYFSATIFTMLGFPIPTLTSLVVAGTNFVFTIAALLLVDRIGRRRVLLYSVPFMIAGLVFAAQGFSVIDLASTDTRPERPPPSLTQRHAAESILVSIMMYVAGYAMGLGNVPWMQSELFALRVRALGSGLATATNWGANFVVGLTFLPLMEILGPSWTFSLYALVCTVGYVCIVRVYPETAGLSLEAAAALLERDDWGVTSRDALD